MKFTVAPIVRRFGYRGLLIWNGLVSCALIAVQGLFTATTAYAIMCSVLLMAGFTRSLQFSALNTLAYADVEMQDMARANALYTVAQQLFLAVGVSAAAFLLDARLWFSGRSELAAGDFSFALVTVSILSALSVFSYVKLQPGAGASITGRTHV
jgi:hypothetical protein